MSSDKVGGQSRHDRFESRTDEPDRNGNTVGEPDMRTAAVAASGVVLAFAMGAALSPHLAPGPGLGAACPAGSQAMSRAELLFGASRKNAPPVSDAEWQAFLDEIVTPRFPDGLTAFAGYGQWRNASGQIIKEPSRLLLIWHSGGTGAQERIEAVRATYKSRFGQESVLRVDGTGCVGF